MASGVITILSRGVHFVCGSNDYNQILCTQIRESNARKQRDEYWSELGIEPSAGRALSDWQVSRVAGRRVVDPFPTAVH